MKYLILVLLLSGCSDKVTVNDYIEADKQCKAIGMEARNIDFGRLCCVKNSDCVAWPVQREN